MRAQADAATEASNILRVQNEVNGLVPAGGGFVTSGDAQAASALYTSLADDFQYMVVAKSAMKIALGAFGQALGYDNAIFGAPGETAPPPAPDNYGDNVNHPTLFIAGTGNETFNANRSSDAFFFSSINGNDIVNGFAPGVGKNLAAFLVTADTIYVQEANSNVILSYGAGASVTLTNLHINALSLYDNVAGVSTASFENNANAVAVNLSSKTSRDQDGLIHIQNIVGTNFDDILRGDSNDNAINGGGGNDLIEGGGGKDTLDGGGGSNTIGYSWATSGVSVDLTTGADSTGSTLRNFTTVAGSRYNDTMKGLPGGALIGGGGYDIYEVSATGGAQTIVNGVAAVSLPQGELHLGAGLDLTHLWFSRSGDDLLLRAIGATDAVTIRNWFANDYSKLDSIGDASGRTIGVEKIGLLVRAMDAYLAANPGFDPSATTGAVDVRTVSNGPVSVPDNSHTIVIGSGDTVDIGAASNVGVIGFGNTVAASGAGDNVWIGGNGQNPSAADSDHVKLSQGTVTVSDNSRVDIEGSHVTEYIGANVTTGIYGANDVVYVSGVGDEVWIGANGHASSDQNYVNFSQGGKVVVRDGSHVDALGNGVVAQLGSNAWAGILGKGDVVTVSGNNDILWIDLNTTATVAGRGDTVNALGANDTVRIGGNGQQSSDADKDHVLFSQGGTFTVSDNSHVEISGHHLTGSVGTNVWASFFGSGDTVNVSGVNDTIWIGANGQQASDADKDYVYLSQGGTAVVLNDSHVDIFGDRVTAQVYSNDWAGVIGRGETVDVFGPGDTIWVGGNKQNASAADLNHVTFSQSGTVVALDDSRVDVGGNNVTEWIGSNVSTGVYGSNNTVNASGSNDALWIAGDAHVNFAQGGKVSVYQNSHVDIVGGNVNAWVDSYVALGLHGGASGFGHDVVDGFNSTDTMQFDHAVFADWTHLLGAAHQSGADTIIAIGADTVTLTNVAMSSLNQNQFQFV